MPLVSVQPQSRVDAVDDILRRSPAIWRGFGTAVTPSVATGSPGLDRMLPGHGWPLGAVTELSPLTAGIGEFRLLVPALRHMAANEGRAVVLIRPPHTPYAPALVQAGLPLRRVVWLAPSTDDEAQWAAEQTLRAGIAGAVVLWSQTRAAVALRRLQLAAEKGQALAFIYRAPRFLGNPSPAAVRLALHPATDALRIDVVKARGGKSGSVLCPLRCIA